MRSSRIATRVVAVVAPVDLDVDLVAAMAFATMAPSVIVEAMEIVAVATATVVV
jgi:hypothetical protein